MEIATLRTNMACGLPGLTASPSTMRCCFTCSMTRAELCAMHMSFEYSRALMYLRLSESTMLLVSLRGSSIAGLLRL